MITNKYKLILIVLGLIPFQAFSQNYIPIPESDAQWTVYQFDYEWNVGETYIYTPEGDTTINSINYKKIYQLNDSNNGQDTIWILHAFMRQDIENKKVFFIRDYLGESTEKLGYDFDVGEGDTLSLPAFAYYEFDSLFTVFPAPDSTLLWNGEWRRSYNFVSLEISGYHLQVIEGVGGIGSPFPNLFFWDPFHQPYLMCHLHEGIYIYGPNPLPEDCDFTVTVEEKSERPGIITYPNPFNDAVTIEFPSVPSKNIQIEIYDPIGNLIESIEVPDNVFQLEVNLSSFAPGLYHLRIYSDNGHLTLQSILKIH